MFQRVLFRAHADLDVVQVSDAHQQHSHRAQKVQIRRLARVADVSVEACDFDD